MIFLAGHGYRCIAHDRRGHGRSSQPWDGNDMDHYADDMAELLDHLDVTNAVLVGFRRVAAKWHAISADMARNASPRPAWSRRCRP